jgi:hypothetical protein
MIAILREIYKKLICSIPKLVSNLIRPLLELLARSRTHTHETNVVGSGNCQFHYMPNIISMYSIFQEKKKIILFTTLLCNLSVSINLFFTSLLCNIFKCHKKI